MPVKIPPKMISYPTLQSVLQYMEANLRFNLSQRLPCIRAAEKTVPLQIVNYYSNGEDVLTINNTSYYLELEREYSEDWDCRSMETSGDVPTSTHRFRAHAEHDRRWRKANKTLPSHDFSIKLTIVAKKEQQSEKVAYSKKLHEAYNYRITKLLGRGHSVVRVKNLYISKPGFVLSWPLDLKLVVQSLTLWRIEDMEHLQKILCDTSFPLQQLEIYVFSEEWPETTKKVIEETDRLVLGLVPNYEFLRHRIRNRRFSASGGQLVALDFLNIVRDWRGEKRKIGSCWEFSAHDSPEIRQFFKSLKCQVGVIPVGEKNIHIPTDANTTIEVVYNVKQWELSIKIVSNETLELG